MVWPRIVKLLLATAVAVALFRGGWGMRRDLNLVNTNAGKKESLSWELGEVESHRIIGKDVWAIAAKNVIRDHPVDRLSGISALITGPSGERTINAPSGDYDSKKKELTLVQAEGVWKRPQYPMSWKTPLAHWMQKGDQWDFPKGVTISGDVYSLECESAQMIGQKDVHVTNGCLRWWN